MSPPTMERHRRACCIAISNAMNTVFGDRKEKDSGMKIAGWRQDGMSNDSPSMAMVMHLNASEAEGDITQSQR